MTKRSLEKESPDTRRDEVLKRMLQTPHKPHVPIAMKAPKKKKAAKKNPQK